MFTIRARNVNDAYTRGLELIRVNNILQDSRNGRVLRVPEPVAIRYAKPLERVLFDATRDANPFFHLFEALWMLTGANDLATPAYFVPSFANFSDDGDTLHGAYGHRWRWQFDRGTHAPDPTSIDQLDEIVQILGANHDDRRAVLQMWDPTTDLGRIGKDMPCNLTATFQIILEADAPKLCMTVFNRSNDAIWGAFGANAVHFSVLQEYLATRLAVDVGWYEQVSTNLHAYADKWPMTWGNTDPYQRPTTGVVYRQLVDDPTTFDDECEHVVGLVVHSHTAARSYSNRFFNQIAIPMLRAYVRYRANDLGNAVVALDVAINEYGRIDWLVAGAEWLMRRVERRRHGGAS